MIAGIGAKAAEMPATAGPLLRRCLSERISGRFLAVERHAVHGDVTRSWAGRLWSWTSDWQVAGLLRCRQRQDQFAHLGSFRKVRETTDLRAVDDKGMATAIQQRGEDMQHIG